MRILAVDIATIGALYGEDADGRRVKIHFDLRAPSVARTGRKRGHIYGDHGVLMRSLHHLVEQAIERFIRGVHRPRRRQPAFCSSSRALSR